MERLQQAIEKARTMRQAAQTAGMMAQAGTQAGMQAAQAGTGGPSWLHHPAGARMGLPRPDQARPDQAAAPWRALGEMVPDLAALERQRVVTLLAGPEAAHWDLLRGRIVDQARRHGWRRIVLVSPHGGAGRSTALANLALSFARAPDLRMIGLDLDLRRPALARLLGQEAVSPMAASMEDVLARRIPFAAVARRLGERMAVGFAHAPAADLGALLAARSTRAALDEIDATYAPDIVLADAPPLAAGAPADAALALADAAILLLEAGRDTVKQADKAERHVAHLTNVLGTVITKAD
ncbi:MAG: hypothetical protein KGK00_13935 [Paracoccaceae bacterium]|nr:hypothetical protein [Paracoccaceae bacterium]